MFATQRNREGTSLNRTPSKNSKYDNYTPRKRYVKEQEQFNSYQHIYSRERPSLSPLRQQQPVNYYRVTRNLSASRREIAPRVGEALVQNVTFGGNEIKGYQNYDIPEALEDCTNLLNCRPSLRKQQIMKNFEERQTCRRMLCDSQNEDSSNRLRQRYTKGFVEPQQINSTPRRVHRNKENSNSLTEKMTALQNKIAKLQRMTPQRPATPLSRRASDNYVVDSAVILFEKEDPRVESTANSQVSLGSSQVMLGNSQVNLGNSQNSIGNSQVSMSERESELLSRVSLGRLVEQEQGQNEIEMIQDLSYKISAKLKSIIRNFS